MHKEIFIIESAIISATALYIISFRQIGEYSATWNSAIVM
jgi:hypothetical protein